MKILAVECSAKPVSAVIVSGGKIISSAFSDINLTHSQTLFPIIKSALDAARISFADIDALGVSTGPGSFTGLRIGIAAIKGLAEPNDIKCAGVSSLLAAAYMFKGENAVICPVMDARCGQVYNAIFRTGGDKFERLCNDRAIMTDDLISELKGITAERVILCCDAAQAVFAAAGGQANITLAPQPLIMQNAAGVGLYADEQIKAGNYISASDLMPFYLKLPQAERELKARREGEKI